MIDFNVIYRKMATVLTPEEIQLINQDRQILAYIVQVDFGGKYIVSDFELSAQVKSMKFNLYKNDNILVLSTEEIDG